MPIDRTSHLTVQKPDPHRGRRPVCQAFAHFLCSNVGLIFVVVAYSIGGAFLFILLEQYVELQNCQQGNLQENVSIANISESLFNYVTLSDEDQSVIDGHVESYLQNFTNDVYDRRSKYRYSGQDCPTKSGWSFPSALLFTISIVTSIGFGHITPISWEGQITCICYALIGIPIFLLCLANISSILGDMFRFMYSTFLHCVCCCCRIYAHSRRPKHRGKQINAVGFEYVGTTSVDPTWPETLRQANDSKFYANDYPNQSDAIDDDIDDEINDVFYRMESRVPILVVISIIIGYICLGAIMFNYFEGWSMTIAVYFCYITLATVGFGDYVPGITSGSTEGLRFVAASLYIILGLAVLAMCFDLIKESIVDKFVWLAQKLGFATDGDDEYDKESPQYADFQYSQPTLHMNKSFHGKTPRSDLPPAYDDYITTKGH